MILTNIYTCWVCWGTGLLEPLCNKEQGHRCPKAKCTNPSCKDGKVHVDWNSKKWY